MDSKYRHQIFLIDEFVGFEGACKYYDYKDKVDELPMEMSKNAFLFEELEIELNDQVQILSNSGPTLPSTGKK